MTTKLNLNPGTQKNNPPYKKVDESSDACFLDDPKLTLETNDNFGHECVLCSESFNQPICHECLAEQVKSWLKYYPDIKKKISPKINSFVNEVEDLIIESSSCVACNKNKAALCPYCFTDKIYRILKKSKTSPMVIGDFIATFNFDLDHTGYTLEEEEGLKY